MNIANFHRARQVAKRTFAETANDEITMLVKEPNVSFTFYRDPEFAKKYYHHHTVKTGRDNLAWCKVEL